MLRGKATDKVAQYGHAQLTTFGIGADLAEAQWRAVLRQLIALGHVRTEGEYNTLELAPSARAVLRGEVPLLLRQPSETSTTARGAGRKRRDRTAGSSATSRSGAGKPPPLPLDAEATGRYAALKAWRSEVAREHNLPAYIVFQDAVLAEMARVHPGTLDELAEISGVGAKKLEAYGEEILRVLGG